MVPTPSDSALFLRVAVDSALAGAHVLKGYFSAAGAAAAGIEIENKSRNDLVSKADRESEDAIIGVIRDQFPNHQIIAEESGFTPGGESVRWIIDPLDGTTNFLQGLPIWSISVACEVQDRLVAGVIYEPMANNLYAAGYGLGATRNGEEIFVSTKSNLEGGLPGDRISLSGECGSRRFSGQLPARVSSSARYSPLRVSGSGSGQHGRWGL